MVAQQCRDAAFSLRHCALNVPVALSEALSNAILRGNCERHEKLVYVRTEVNAEWLVIEVEDEGPGFNLDECLSDPTTPENLERETGRGLFLMARLMDRVERFTNGRNVVRMTLRRHE